jgi:hypothetical protein
VLIRDAEPDDWTAIWPFFHAIVSAGRTYSYDRDMDEERARAIWMVKPPGRVSVAIGEGGEIVGSSSMYPNRGEEMIEWARDRGFRAIQFNAVVETNTGAVKLWCSLGFDVLATVPEAFDHPEHGLVGLQIMHRFV